jgi:hypothetical protein
MKRVIMHTTASAVLLILLTTGCGTTGNDTTAGGGIGGTGISTTSVGKIEGFGSVIVNGVEFETGPDTVITKDGESSDEMELNIGMVVTVTGTLNDDGITGTAETIEFNDELEGPIDTGSINITAGTFSVLGQVIRVTPDTVFRNTADLSTLTDGNVVEVSGFLNADGSIEATHIEKKADFWTPGSEIEVKGTVSNLNTTNRTFNLGSQLVDYSGAVLKDGLVLSDGLYVEVKSTQGVVNNALIASEVELEEGVLSGIGEGEEVEIEGFVTRFVSASDFDVNGQPVITTSATVFEGGTASDLQLGAKLDVEGTVNADGALVAEEVEFEGAEDSSGPGGG